MPIGFIFYKKTLEPKEFILNFIGISSSYNGEWWFFKIYVLLILTLPLTKKVISTNFFKSFFFILGIYVLNIFIVKLGIKFFPDFIYIKKTYLFSIISLFLTNQISFFIGYLAFEFDLFKLIKLKLINLKLDNKFIYLILSLIIFFVRFIIQITSLDFLLAPIFIFSTTNLFYKNKLTFLFNILGRHSTNMWLVHSFFCYTYFQNIIFFLKIHY